MSFMYRYICLQFKITLKPAELVVDQSNVYISAMGLLICGTFVTTYNPKVILYMLFWTYKAAFKRYSPPKIIFHTF